MNKVQLSGMICKEPIHRVTPLFSRAITDLLIAVERPSGNWDYIPCILQGNDAERAKTLEVGNCVEVDGRLQSRVYEKKLGNGKTENKVFYEVNVKNFWVVDGEDGV